MVWPIAVVRSGRNRERREWVSVYKRDVDGDALEIRIASWVYPEAISSIM